MNFSVEPFAFIEGIGGPEMVLILVVVLVLFGGQKLPELARGLGKSMKEFKKAASGVEEEFKRALEEDEPKKFAPKFVAAPATDAALPAPEAPVPVATEPPAPVATEPPAPVATETPAPDSAPVPAPVIVPAAPPAPAASLPPPVARSHGQADV
jgi:sec-independent protein translocase protein TatA